MKTSFITVGLAALAALPLAGLAQKTGPNRAGAVSLKLNFQPGNRFSYTTQVAQDVAVQGTKMTQNITMGNTFAVQAGPGQGSKDLRMTYSRVAMAMDAGGQQLRYDSQDTTTRRSPLAGMLGGMVGHSLTLTVSDKGEITDVKGIEELKKSVLAGSPDPALSQQLSQSLNAEQIRKNVGQSFNIYPDHPVKPGASWVKDAAYSMGPLAMKQTTTYTLGSAQRGVAHLLVSGKLTADGSTALTGTQSGTLDVDVATGMVRSGSIRQTMSGDADGTPMSIATSTTITGQKL